MKKRYIAAILLLLLLAFLFMSPKPSAPVYSSPPPWPNLPKIAVYLTVVDGSGSYYVSTLSGIPEGYNVYDQSYPGWCIDCSTFMERSVPHWVVLYSSLDSDLQAPLSDIYWNAINYVLNHKQGSMMEIQEAIWFFTDGFTPDGSHTDAWAMISGAQANPSFVPERGDALAIICYNAVGALGVQNSIFEIRVP